MGFIDFSYASGTLLAVRIRRGSTGAYWRWIGAGSPGWVTAATPLSDFAANLTETNGVFSLASVPTGFAAATTAGEKISVEILKRTGGSISDAEWTAAPVGASLNVVWDGSGLVAASEYKASLIQNKTDNLPPDPADASDIATRFTTVDSSLATIAGYIDTEVGQIKAKTDLLAFTAGKIDAQVRGYDTSLDPATQVLVTPAQKLATDSSGRVTVGSLSAAALQSFWDVLAVTAFANGSMGKLFVTNLNATISSRLAAVDYYPYKGTQTLFLGRNANLIIPWGVIKNTAGTTYTGPLANIDFYVARAYDMQVEGTGAQPGPGNYIGFYSPNTANPYLTRVNQQWTMLYLPESQIKQGGVHLYWAHKGATLGEGFDVLPGVLEFPVQPYGTGGTQLNAIEKLVSLIAGKSGVSDVVTLGRHQTYNSGTSSYDWTNNISYAFAPLTANAWPGAATDYIGRFIVHYQYAQGTSTGFVDAKPLVWSIDGYANVDLQEDDGPVTVSAMLTTPVGHELSLAAFLASIAGQTTAPQLIVSNRNPFTESALKTFLSGMWTTARLNTIDWLQSMITLVSGNRQFKSTAFPEGLGSGGGSGPVAAAETIVTVAKVGNEPASGCGKCGGGCGCSGCSACTADPVSQLTLTHGDTDERPIRLENAATGGWLDWQERYRVELWSDVEALGEVDVEVTDSASLYARFSIPEGLWEAVRESGGLYFLKVIDPDGDIPEVPIAEVQLLVEAEEGA